MHSLPGPTSSPPETVSPDALADVFKRLPRRIAIGAYTFRVQVVPETHKELADADGNPAYDGMTITHEQRIFLSESMPLHRALNVVQHEVSHAINWVYEVTDSSTEEQFVTLNTNGLVEVQIRNPRYVAWVNSAVRRFKKESTK